jgi:hypothetical protein
MRLVAKQQIADGTVSLKIRRSVKTGVQSQDEAAHTAHESR